MGTVTAPPVKAELYLRDRDKTVVRLTLFRKHADLPFEGTGHLAAATKFVGEWNEHFEEAWMLVRETSASIMGAFIRALEGVGVGKTTISNAMEAVKRDAQG